MHRTLACLLVGLGLAACGAGAESTGGASGGARGGGSGGNGTSVTGTGGTPATPGAGSGGAGAFGGGGGGTGAVGPGGRGVGAGGGAGVAGPGGGGGAAGSGARGGTTGAAGGGGRAAGGAGAVGGAGGTVASTAYKGLAFTEPQGVAVDCQDLARLKVSWFYNWTAGTKCQIPGVEYVPHLARSWEKETWIPHPRRLVEMGYKVALGFNEPDHADQANLSVDEVLRLWPETDQPGLRIGSPAAASDGQRWFEAFMQGVAERNLRVDFIAIHWYGWTAGTCNDVSLLEEYILWAEQWRKPIWITEWGCRAQSAAVTRKFLNDAVAMFARHPLIERYAWFLSRSDGEFAGGALIDPAGTLTAMGTDYAAKPATR